MYGLVSWFLSHSSHFLFPRHLGVLLVGLYFHYYLSAYTQFFSSFMILCSARALQRKVRSTTTITCDDLACIKNKAPGTWMQADKPSRLGNVG